MSRPIRAAVIGVGHFGQYHASKLAEAKGVEFVAAVDRHAERAAKIAARHNVKALTDYRELFGKVDAVSIATPPASHYAIARDFLDQGAHVLVEKPITETVEDAQSLIDLAARRGRVLQVGHIERFSTVSLRMGEMVKRPLFIQAQRVGTFKPRGEAVSVVFDLMIHDLDLILGLVRSPIEWVHAIGRAGGHIGRRHRQCPYPVCQWLCRRSDGQPHQFPHRTQDAGLRARNLHRRRFHPPAHRRLPAEAAAGRRTGGDRPQRHGLSACRCSGR